METMVMTKAIVTATITNYNDYIMANIMTKIMTI